MNEKTPSEFELIAALFAPLATHPGALGLSDDAAIVSPASGTELVVTADALVEGVHFLPDDPPDTIAAKALGVNASDLAAKGADMEGFLLALALPARLDFPWLTAFAEGLDAASRTFGLPLLGGDTTATPGPLTIAITAMGTVPKGTMIRRSGAKVGDGVYVSGHIGDAGAGLQVLTHGKNDIYLAGRYRIPTPRLKLGRALRGIASAALDVSDGLIADLGHIGATSGVAIDIDAACVPLSDALIRLWGTDEAAIVRAATAGDDYELAFTAPDAKAVMAAAEKSGTPVTRIGTVRTGTGVHLLGKAGEIRILRPGFTHF